MIAEPMAVGAAIFAAGAVFGRVMPARRRGPRPQEPPQPICGCARAGCINGALALHDRETGRCHGQIERYGDYELSGVLMFGTYYVPCPCRRYTGPEPLPEFYAPEIAGGAS